MIPINGERRTDDRSRWEVRWGLFSVCGGKRRGRGEFGNQSHTYSEWSPSEIPLLHPMRTRRLSENTESRTNHSASRPLSKTSILGERSSFLLILNLPHWHAVPLVGIVISTHHRTFELCIMLKPFGITPIEEKHVRLESQINQQRNRKSSKDAMKRRDA